MPAVLRQQSAYSLQGCERGEFSSVPVSRASRRAETERGNLLAMLLPASRPLAGVAARSAPPRGGEGAACLSIGHNDTFQPSSAPKVAKIPTFRIWRGASLGETPGIPNHGHSSSGRQDVQSKRGKILNFSEGSRRNLQAAMAKIRHGVDLYTGCLSAPGYADHLSHPLMKAAFLRFGKRLTAKSARDSRFRSVAGFWKQELQKRNMLHFHLVLAGVAENDVAVVQRWIMEQWVECVFSIPGMPPEIVREERLKMEMVHFHSSNFEKVRGNFQSYFAKYLGKDVEAHAAENPIPGRWWGVFNGPSIPLGKLQELPLPSRVAVHAQRVARKIRQARADNARHRALCRKFDMIENGQPLVSRQSLLRCYQSLQSVGGFSALVAWEAGECPAVRKLVVNGDTAPFRLLLAAHVAGVRLEGLLGRFKFPPAMKFSSVRLTGSHVPEMMLRIIQHAGARALIDRECAPF